MNRRHRILIGVIMLTGLALRWGSAQNAPPETTICQLIATHSTAPAVYCQSSHGAYIQNFSPFSIQGRLAPYTHRGSKRSHFSGVEHLTLGLPICINTASEADLEALPGIGHGKAMAIVSNRQESGLFTSVEDLQRVRGIGPATISRLHGLITIEEDL